MPAIAPSGPAAGIDHTSDEPKFAVSTPPAPGPAAVPHAGPPYAPGIWEYMPVSPDYPKNVPIPQEMTKKYPTRQMTSLTPNAYAYNLGDHKAVVVLVEFTDTKHQSGNSQAHYDALMNANGSSDRSVRTFLYVSSAGNYTLTSTVSAWVTLPNNESYYANAGYLYLVGDAAAAADSQIDFSQFDESGDGWVDNFIIVHAGRDQASTGDGTEIWSHAGVGYSAWVDGKRVSPYCTVAEDITYGSHLGTIAHEFGHLGLDLPDLYDTSYNNAGLGEWDIMAAGAWGGGGYAPNLHSAWSKYRLGWIDPVVPSTNIDPYTIYPETNTAQRNPVKIETNYTNEYFLAEFRYKLPTARYDGYLPTSGLVIYHVDSNVVANTWDRNRNTVETNTAHKGIDIEEVGIQDMDQAYWNTGSSNDVWISSAAGFAPTSTPNSNLYVNANGYATGIKVYNLSGVLVSGGIHMTFSIDTGRVNYNLAGRTTNAAEQSVLPGATATYHVQFTTFASSGDAVTLSLEGVDSGIGVLDQSTLTLPPYGSATVDLVVTMPSYCSAGEAKYVNVRGSSTQSPSSFVVPTLTRCAQVYAVDIFGEFPSPATPTVTLTQDFTIRNTGNGDDNITLSATFDPGLIDVSILSQPLNMGRGASVSVQIAFTVRETVLDGTVIPVSVDVRHGPATAARHIYLDGSVTAARLSRLSLEVQAPSLQRLDAGVPQTFTVAVTNSGNYLAEIHLAATAPAGVTVLFDAATLQVPAFSSTVVTVTVTAARDVPAGTRGDVWFSADTLFPPTSAFASLTVLINQRFEVSLTGDTSITASPGAAIAFNLVAINLGNGQDNVTLQISPSLGAWNTTLTPSSIGLGADATTRSYNVQLGAMVPPDAPGNLLQEFTVTLLSQRAGVFATLRVSVLVVPVYSFNVSVDAAQGAISSSESATFLLTFRNTGNVHDSYSVTVVGLPEGWTFEFAEGGVRTLEPRFTGVVTLIIKPLATASADRYDFQLFATSEGDLAQRRVIEQSVQIAAHREIRLTVTSVDGEVRPGAVVTVNIIVQNLGNVEERVILQGVGSFGSVNFDPFQVTVKAYEESISSVVIVLRDDQPAGYTPLEVSATSISNSSVTSQNTVGIQVAPPPAQPTIPAAGALTALAALALVSLSAVALRRRR